MGKILEKHHNGTGGVADGQHKQEQAGTVIENLNQINRRITMIDGRNDYEHHDEKGMDKRRRNDLDDGQDANLEYNLFHEVLILSQRIRTRV